MNTKSFKNLVISKTGLTNSEYKEVFSALEEKYNISEDYIASQLPDKISGMDADVALSIAFPTTAKEEVSVTRYDRLIANELGVDEESIGKLTQFGEAASERIEHLEKVPLGIGEQIKEVVNDTGMDAYLGTQKEIGKSIVNNLEITNNVENAQHSQNLIGNIQSINNRVVDNSHSNNENNTVNSNIYDYYNENTGIGIKGMGNNMRVYNVENDGHRSLICTVQCSRDNRESFIEEFKEQENRLTGNEGSIVRNIKILSMSKEISSELKENEIGTGNKLFDKVKADIEEKQEKLENKINYLEEKMDKVDNKYLNNIMNKAIEDAQKELALYQEQLDKLDKMEIENAKYMKLQIENAQTELKSQLEKVDNIQFLPDTLKDNIKESIQSQISGLNDKLSIVNETLASKDAVNVTDNNEESKLSEFKNAVVENFKNAREESKEVVVNLDNIVGNVKENISNWAQEVKNAGADKLAEQSDKFYDKFQDNLDNIKDALRDFKDDLSKDISNIHDDIKDLAKDIDKELDDMIENSKEVEHNVSMDLEA